MRAFSLGVNTPRGRNPNFYIKVVSRQVIRIGNEYTFFILYANRTNTDATNVPLVIKVPNYVSVRPKFDQPFQTTQQGDNTFITLNLPKVPAISNTTQTTPQGDNTFNTPNLPKVLAISDTNGLQSLPITVKVQDPNRAHNSFRVFSFIPSPNNNVNVTVYVPDLVSGNPAYASTSPLHTH